MQFTVSLQISIDTHQSGSEHQISSRRIGNGTTGNLESIHSQQQEALHFYLNTGMLQSNVHVLKRCDLVWIFVVLSCQSVFLYYAPETKAACKLNNKNYIAHKIQIHEHHLTYTRKFVFLVVI